MKIITFLVLFAMMLFAGDVLAVDLNGTWFASNECVPGDIPESNLIPKVEDSVVALTQEGVFFTTYNAENDEVCGGVVSGKNISITCPGSLFNGEFKPPGTIIGVNHIPEEGVTCSIVAVRQ